MSDHSKSLLVQGDFLEDVYAIGRWEGNRFKPSSVERLAGGAGNTFANAQAILSESFIPVEIEACGGDALELWRFIDEEDRHPTLMAYLEPTSTQVRPFRNYPRLDYYDGILVSDYNKGGANRLDYVTAKPIAPWIIVDSRYRSTSPILIGSYAETKIWRCTGLEYNREWAKNFDYVVHTDGPENIIVSSSKGQMMTYSIPGIDVVDTCGAGDTFDAALAAYLLLTLSEYPKGLSNFDPIVDALEFCVEAAQDVCTQPYTSITLSRI